jgi:hypothetical protein
MELSHHILSAKNLEIFFPFPFSVGAWPLLLLPVDSSTAADITVGGRSGRLPDAAATLGASELEEGF